MMEWWQRVDRQDVVEAARELIQGHGCLVLVGDEHSGRDHALSLVEDVLSSCDLGVLGIGSDDQPATLRTLLHQCWKTLVPRRPGYQPEWVIAHGAMSTRDIVGRIREAALSGREPCALVLRDLGRDCRLEEYDLALIDVMVSEIPCPVVISACEESHSPWHLLRRARVVRLTPFTEADVRSCLEKHASRMRVPPDEFDEFVGFICGPDPGNVQPARAYHRLALYAPHPR
jgi:hypothetical protein